MDLRMKVEERTVGLITKPEFEINSIYSICYGIFISCGNLVIHEKAGMT